MELVRNHRREKEFFARAPAQAGPARLRPDPVLRMTGQFRPDPRSRRRMARADSQMTVGAISLLGLYPGNSPVSLLASLSPERLELGRR
jgi:hypothetical protein